MAIFELYSKNQKRLRDGVPEIFNYDNLPSALRVQIVLILEDLFCKTFQYDISEAGYNFTHRTLCREYGVFTLGESDRDTDRESISNHIIFTDDIETVFDVIQIAFEFYRISKSSMSVSNTPRGARRVITLEEIILELNDRFKEHGMGYQFESGKIIRVDTTYTHSEITKPTLQLLWNPKFSGANEEYLKAHEHYRHGRNKECLNECLKSFESTLKIICSEKGWSYSPNDTSKKLIQICFSKGLIPTFTQNQFTSLQSLIESGIPTVRNKLGGHGQGQVPQKVDDDITRYALNLTGSNIIFLIEQSGIK